MTQTTPAPPENLFTAPALPAVILDRSTIERYPVCPFQAHAIETGVVCDESAPATSGQEVHRVIAEAIGEYVQAGQPPADYIRQEAPKVRPDVADDAQYALAKMAWKIDQYLTSRNPADIIAFQGGPGEKSGQLSMDLLPATDTRGPVRITSEIDLLMAGGSENELHEIDFKSGWKPWATAQVRAAFQFKLHAALIFRAWPDLSVLRVQVWTRSGYRTPWAWFGRRDAENAEGTILEAIRCRDTIMSFVAEKGIGALQEHASEFCWPDPEKCRLCRAIYQCPKAPKPMIDLQADPVVFAKDTEVLDLLIAERKAHQRAYVDQHGDIEWPGGGWGLGAPKTPRKPSAAQYKAYQSAGTDDDGTDA